MLTYKKRNSTYKRRQTVARPPEITINFKKRKDKDEEVATTSNLDNIMVDTTTSTTSATSSSAELQQTPLPNKGKEDKAIIPLSPTSLALENSSALLNSIHINSPNSSPIAAAASDSSLLSSNDEIPFGKSFVEHQQQQQQQQSDVAESNNVMSTPSNNNKKINNTNSSSKSASKSKPSTPASTTKKIKVAHTPQSKSSVQQQQEKEKEMPPAPAPEPVKILVSKDTKDILEILKPILDQQLKSSSTTLKPFLRECCKKFVSEITKKQVIKENSPQHVQLFQQMSAQQQQQYQQQLTLLQQQLQEQQQLEQQLQLQQQVNESMKQYNRNVKVIEVERRIATMVSLIDRWKKEEQQWSSILSEFTQTNNNNNSNSNNNNNSNNNFNASILKTPSRSTRTAPTLNSTAKKKPPPQVMMTPVHTKPMNLTTSFLSTLSTPARPGNPPSNLSLEDQQRPQELTEDPKIASIRDSILSISMRLDEVLPRLNQVQNTTLEIQNYCNELSLFFHDQLFTKQHKNINQANKLIMNLKTLSIAIDNDQQQTQQ